VDFVLNTINGINQENNDLPFITDTFKQCGLNPLSKPKSLEAFHKHLTKFESNAILQGMITNQKAVTPPY
jgi:hypothetical protein